MTGTFVQLNLDSRLGKSRPVGYVVSSSGCWEWVGALTNGYGRAWDAENKRLVRAHRLMYERNVGPVPVGMTLDHRCRNRRCVRPDHLEPVTIRENVLRGIGITAKNIQKTHCSKGHELSGANLTFQLRGKYQNRVCKTCDRWYSDEAAKNRRRRERLNRSPLPGSPPQESTSR